VGDEAEDGVMATSQVVDDNGVAAGVSIDDNFGTTTTGSFSREGSFSCEGSSAIETVLINTKEKNKKRSTLNHPILSAGCHWRRIIVQIPLPAETK
jgi:hypothetical protein